MFCEDIQSAFRSSSAICTQKIFYREAKIFYIEAKIFSTSSTNLHVGTLATTKGMANGAAGGHGIVEVSATHQGGFFAYKNINTSFLLLGTFTFAIDELIA